MEEQTFRCQHRTSKLLLCRFLPSKPLGFNSVQAATIHGHVPPNDISQHEATQIYQAKSRMDIAPSTLQAVKRAILRLKVRGITHRQQARFLITRSIQLCNKLLFDKNIYLLSLRPFSLLLYMLWIKISHHTGGEQTHHHRCLSEPVSSCC